MREGHAECRWIGGDPVGDGQRREDAVDREADDRHLRAARPAPRPAPGRCGRRCGRARSPAPARRRDSTSVRPFWPCRSGALTTTGPEISGRSSSPPTTHERGCGTPLHRRAARAGGACSWRAPRSAARSGAAGPSAAIRAATPTGQSVPGAMIPSISSAPTSRSIAGSSSVERMQRRSASGNPGAPGSRSTTATQSPRARAASSRPSWAGPAPRTRRRAVPWRGSLSTTSLSRYHATVRSKPSSKEVRAASRAVPAPCRGPKPMRRRPGRARSGRCAADAARRACRARRARRWRCRRPDVDARRDVDHLAGDRVDRRLDHALDRLRVVEIVEPVA